MNHPIITIFMKKNRGIIFVIINPNMERKGQTKRTSGLSGLSACSCRKRCPKRKYFTGILLNDEDMDLFTNTVFHTRGKISVSKYVKPKPRLIYNHVQKKWTTLEFNSEIVYSDKKICSVYRLDDVDKNIIKDSRQACALIY